jgi:hypothetical protein
MGLEVLTARDDRPPRRQYQRLRGELSGGDGEEAACRWTRARRPLRLRKRVGMAPLRAGNKRGARLLMRLLLALVPARRVAALLAELVRRIASAGAAAAECPAIVFSSQWGLPALSHSASGGASRRAKLRAFYLERSLSAGSSSSGAASPC